MKKLRDKLTEYIATINVTSPAEEDEIPLEQANLLIQQARNMVSSLAYINSIATTAALRNDFMSISQEISDIELNYSPAIAVALKAIRKLSRRQDLHQEVELKNRIKNNFLWNMGDQSRLPQFQAHVEKHFTKKLYPDEEGRL